MSWMKNTMIDHYDQAWKLGYDKGYAAALAAVLDAAHSLTSSDTPDQVLDK